MTSARLTPRGGTYPRTSITGIPPLGPTRQYRAQWLDDRGDIREAEQTAPASPLLDSAHSAFVRGTLINTTCGPIAIEDLLPGDRVVTPAQGPMAVLWIGSMTLPAPGPMDAPCRMTRIMTESFGAMRPLSDLIVGPGARFLSHPRHLRARFGSEPVLTPAHAMTDGMQIIDMYPRQAVTLYHICLEQHAIISASGLETESFHPGTEFERGLNKSTVEQFLSFFPHIRVPRDFGPMAHMRLPLDMPGELDI